MTGFSAVVTTGIYCRPGCSARPLARNVRHFDLAAAAEAAGFRACLRCRPYRTSQTDGLAGPDLICRGIQLIVDGALDDATEADLGARLGVSARHLRRLFVSRRTVETHVAHVFTKLGQSNRAQLATEVVRHAARPEVTGS